MNKPEIGCKPYYIVACDRIVELSEAIIRYANDGAIKNFNTIGKWAAEIELFCAVANAIYGGYNNER